MSILILLVGLATLTGGFFFIRKRSRRPGLNLSWAEGNILFDRNHNAAAIYRLQTFGKECATMLEQKGRMYNTAALLNSLKADHKLLLVHEEVSADLHVAYAHKICDPKYDPALIEQHFEIDADYIDLNTGHKAYVFLIIPLINSGNREGVIDAFLRSCRETIDSIFGTTPTRRVSADTLARLRVEEHQHLANIRNYQPAAQAATQGEIQWLIRRAAQRNVANARIDPNLTSFDAIVIDDETGTSYEPLEEEIWTLDNHPIKPTFNYLKTITEDGVFFQTFLFIGSLPASFYPGGSLEIATMINRRVTRPVDICVINKNIGHQKSASLVRRRGLEHDANALEVLQTQGHVGDQTELEERRYLSRAAAEYFRRGDAPTLYKGTISIAISARTEQELEQNVNEVKSALNSLRLERPQGSMLDAYYDFMPTPQTESNVLGYAKWFVAEEIACLDLFVQERCGDPDGLFLATIPSDKNRPVYVDVPHIAKRDVSPAILITGSLGSGKTMLAQHIAVGCAFRGSKVWTIDPKGDDHNICAVEGLEDRSVFVRLGDKRLGGLLDPLAGDFGDSEEAQALKATLAISVINGLISQSLEKEVEDSIQLAVTDAIKAGHQSSYAIIDNLAKSANPAAHEAAKSLRSKAESGIAGLLFANPTEPNPGERFRDKDVIVFQADNISLPDQDTPRAEYTVSEREGIVIFQALSAYLLREARAANKIENRHSVILIDEAWALMQSSESRSFLTKLLRMSRSWNATSIFASQYPSDLDRLADLVPTRFALGQESQTQALNSLRSVGIDVDTNPNLAKKLVEYLQNSRHGRGIMRDHRGNIVKIQSVVPDELILQTLSTTPESA